MIKRAVKADPSVVAHRTKRTRVKPSWRIEAPKETSAAAANG